MIDNLRNLKVKLSNFNDKISTTHDQIITNNQINKLKEDKINDILNNSCSLVKINIGGKLFVFLYSIINHEKTNLFTELYKTKEDTKEIYFIDRNPLYFNYIIDYLKNRKINFDNFCDYEIKLIKDEFEFYGIKDTINLIDNKLQGVNLIGFNSSLRYLSFGTHLLDDLNNTDLKTGICVSPPSFINIEFQNIVDVISIKIGGYKDKNSTTWKTSYGSDAIISTSTDNNNYTVVGKIPSYYSDSIIDVKLTKSKAKFIKFNSESYLGIGYLKVFSY